MPSSYKMNKSFKKQKTAVLSSCVLFTSIIIFFHINLDLWDQKKIIAVIRDIPVTFFNHGNIGVEFFFLVTGWLMAKSIYSRYIQTKTTSYTGGTGTGLFTETINFVTHKARAIFPYYLLACALTPLVRVMTDRTLTFSYFLNRLPSAFSCRGSESGNHSSDAPGI